ncbi:xin actin-binding repeat-containing protein 2 isoform X2 [Oncorhynchus clarkii lewisi]|uniref:xin actin-binding repeat-containing protein 2 isoform X2 n=1 Tax=Oncorhynchus clarkii lewisi TaxID=490388 RepID=UPI0039B8AF4A
MAMSQQAAVSKQQDNAFSSGVMEESEVCSVPGGFASVRAQFENQETATSHNVSQFHFHRRAVQEVQLNSEVTMRSTSRDVIPASQQAIFHQDEQVTHEENSFTSIYDNNHNDEREEEGPRLTTKELRDHFERTIEEAAPSKPMKIGRADINRSHWASNISEKPVSAREIKNVSSAIQNFSSSEIHNVSASDIWENAATEVTEDTSAIAVDYEDTDYFPPPPPEDLEYFPPPPPDLLQVPSESPDMPVECYYSPEPPESAYPSKRPLSRQEYFRQRNQYELKRLYKHIHPEVRKNLEMYSDVAEYENTRPESQEEFTGETRYIYEDNGSSPNDCISPEEEYLEWDEILRGEVQSMRWMFENKPLDAIKDDASNEDDDQNMEQEMIVGSDVRSKAWMFETKPMDALGSDNIALTKYRHKFNTLDKGDVRAAAWLFENQPMETLNKMHGDEELTKEIVFTQEDGSSTIHMLESQYMETLGHTETIDDSHLLSLRSVLEEIKGEVKTITSTFETQFMCVLMGQSGQMLEITSIRKVETEKGDTKTSTWLFDTQALDMANKPAAPVKLVCSLSMEDNYKGDVPRSRWLFETKTLDSVNEDEWESSMLQKEEIIGADVRKHCLAFETQPMDPLKDDANARPPTIGGNVRSARHFFETSPEAALTDLNEVGSLKMLVAAEKHKGDNRPQKWMFENERLEDIRDEKKGIIRTVNLENLTEDQATSYNADVRKNCMVFETQPMDTLKDDSNARALSKAEIVRGNVRSARHYFETTPADNIKDLAEVGKLQKMVRLDEEKGDVRHQKWVFESQPLEHIQEEKKEVIRTINLEEIDQVDVSNYKQMFETTDLTRWDESQKILVEGVTCGSVKSNKHLFESTPMYAMQDSSGHYHEVKTVRREEVVKGDVTSCKWMFETCPIDQFDESITNYQVIKGISKEEVESGDVKTAKWLFETQPLDAIKYFSNIEDEESKTKESVEIVKGDVKTGKWLFETKLMNVPYEKEELKSENESEEIRKGDVKICTWLFETQPLDTIRDETETVLQTCTVNQEDVQGKDVRMARFLFETENLENITGEDESSKRVTEIDIQSGDVNRMKYIFENQSSDIMTSTSEEFMQRLKTTQSTTQSEDIQKGNVVNCKWLFENQSIDAIRDIQEETLDSRTVTDVQGGNVDKGRFIFETYSLDKIQEVSSEIDITKLQKITCEEEEKGDVRNYTMMFETQPLYAIQDKEGHYHEVTTVTSEEILKGDVIGSRWLFETKPLDSISDTDEVYIIKSVTQEDVQKGDVTSAKWRFETQPLDTIAEDIKMSVKTVEDIQGGDVRMNKQRFESDVLSQKSVRTVNVSEIQKGDVRTAKWMFETQTMDKIRSQSEENLIETVMKEEVLRGDVRQSVWLFEQNPLDHIKEIDEEDTVVIQEEIPKADVKTTTWLFETTPFHDFNENSVEKSEILGKSIKGTLEELYSQKIINSKGVLIEADEIGDVRMAKYQLMNKDSPEIQREEIISGDLSNIMMNLLNRRERIERGVVVESEEKGNISTTVHQLFNQERGISVEKEEILRGDIQEAVNNLLKEGGSAKRGILLQEDEKGDVRMTIYSLLNKEEDISVEKEDIVKGNIRNALQRLSNPESQEQMRIKVDENEKGNVNFYSTCIESGALDYLKQLQVEPDETLPEKVEKEEIIRGDIKRTKLILDSNRAQIERTVDEEDIVCGDVHNSVKVFMTEPTHSLDGLQKEEIVRGDLKAAMNSLSQFVNQTVVVEKEEVVRGNIHKARRHLELAQTRPKEVEKPEIVRGNIKGALRSLEKSTTSKVEVFIEDLVPGDIKGTLKSLEKAKQTVRAIEKEEIVKGNIHTAKQCLQEASNDRRTCQQEMYVQGNVRGTIELLLEPPASPRMTRRPSFEGDVKMSIKSLYETHEVQEAMEEQTQPEKEEVIKGDVKGTIKSLLESAQRAAPKIRVGARRVKVPASSPLRSQQGSPLLRSQQGSHECSVVNKTESETLKNRSQSIEAQRNLRRKKMANSVKTESSTPENQSLSTQNTINTSESQTTQQSTEVIQHTTITQNHGIKTLETKFCNLNSSRKGLIRLDKTKVKTNVLTPTRTLSESELSLPPPPPCDDQSSLTPASSINRLDLDLPPPPAPPPPPPVETDNFPPPPTQDFLPPPPSQYELDSMSSQTPHQSLAKATKVTVKKVKGPVLHQVSKLEPTSQIQKIQHVTSDKYSTIANKSVMEISQTQIESTSFSSTKVSSEIPKPPESPRPLKKVYVAPIRFTHPPSPPPFLKSTQFKTPLIKAEKKYRKQKVGSTSPATLSPIFMHEPVTAALEMLSSETRMEQSNKSMMFGFTQENAEKTVTNVKSDTLSSDFSKHAQISETPSSMNLISAGNGHNLPESAVISATKHHIVSNETSKVSSIQHQTSISSTKQQTVTAAKQQVSSAYTEQSHFAVSSSQVQISTSDAKKVENVNEDVRKDVKNLKTTPQVQISTSDDKKVERVNEDVRKDVKNLKTTSQVQFSTSDDKKVERVNEDVRKYVKNLKTTSQVQISTSDDKKVERVNEDVRKDVKNLKTTPQVQISTSDDKKVERVNEDVRKDVKNLKTTSQVQFSTSDDKKVERVNEDVRKDVKNLKTTSQVQISTSDDKKVERVNEDVRKYVKNLKTTSQVQISTSDDKKVERVNEDVRKDVKNLKTTPQVQISTSDDKKVERVNEDVRKDVKNLKTTPQVQISTSDDKKVENVNEDVRKDVRNLKTTSQVQISTRDDKKVERVNEDVRKDVKNLKTTSQVQISTSDDKKVENVRKDVKNLKTTSQVQISTSDDKKVERVNEDVRKDVKNLKTTPQVQISTSDDKKVENVNEDVRKDVKNLKTTSQVQISTSDDKKVERVNEDVRKDVKNLKTTSQVQISTSDDKKVERVNEDVRKDVKNLKTTSQVQISTSDDKKVERVNEDVTKDVKNLKTTPQVQISTSDDKKVERVNEDVRKDVKNLKTTPQVQISTSDDKKVERVNEDVRKDVKNLKTTYQVQISTSDAKKVEDTKTDAKKDVRNLKTKDSHKSEDKKNRDNSASQGPEKVSDQPTKTEKVTQETIVKAVRSSLEGKNKYDIYVSQAPEKVPSQSIKVENVTSESNVKTGKKKAKGQEKKVEVKYMKQPDETKKEIISQVKDVTKVKVSSEQMHHETEDKVKVKEDSQKALAVNDNQPATPTPARKKKKKKKRSKASAESTKSVSESSTQSQEITVVQMHKAHQEEHIQVHKEVIITESKDESKVHQRIQEQGTVKVEKQVKASQKKKEVTSNQQIQDKPKEEYRNVPVKVESGKMTSQSAQKDPAKPSTGSTEDCLEGTHTTLEKHESKPTSEKIIVGGATQKIHKISIGSSKVESKKTSHESKKQEWSVKSIDRSAPSPLLRTRSPSPTFITIESTQRTASSRRITPSPIPMLRPATPPTPPPRKLEPPTSHINRATPSFTFSRAENLAWIKYTTAQLSCGVTPPPVPLPMQVTENKSDIVEYPASFYRQIKIEEQTEETSEMLAMTIVTAKKRPKKLYEEDQKAAVKVTSGRSFPQMDKEDMDASEMSDSSMVTTSVRDKREFFEEAQKAAENKTYVRKDPIDIPERLGPDMEEPKTTNRDSRDETQSTSEKIAENSTEVVGSTESTEKELMEASEMSELSIVTTSVRDKREFFEEAQKAEINKTYVRKYPINVLEHLGPTIIEPETENQERKEDVQNTTEKITEKISEEVGFMWDDQWVSSAIEAMETSELSDSSSVRDKREFFEETHKAEINKTYVRKDPINVLEHLGPTIIEPETENQERKEDIQNTTEKITEKISEEVGFMWDDQWDSAAIEAMETSELSDSSAVTSVRDKREFFEETHKAKVNKTYVRNDPIDIPERLGPDMEEPKTTNRDSRDETQSTSEKIAENSTEVVGSTASTEKELKEASEMSESSIVTTSVRDKREFFEETHKAKVNKSYVRRDPIDIPERLGPDMEMLEPENQEKENLPKVDLSGLVNKFEKPEEKVYVRKPITMRERRGSETEYTKSDIEDTETQEEQMHTLDIKAIKNVFEMSEQSPSFKDEKKQLDELESNLSENTTDSSKQENTQETQRGSGQISPLPSQKELQQVSADPTDSETKLVTEHFVNLDELGNKTIGSLSSTMVSQHSKSVTTDHPPFSYADVVKKKVSQVASSETPDEASTEELLRNFHETWTESESFFKSLGYSVSEERTSHVVSHQTKTIVTDSSSQVGALHCVSEEGLSDGVSNSGQKKIP